MVAGLVTAMAAPTEKLSDYQTAGLKRVLKSVWDAQGQSMTVDDIAKALCAEQDQRLTDVGEQLFPFTTQGEYGRFFNGQNNVRFTNDFTVLELEELKGRKHLQQVVLLQLIYQIQQEMYLGERDRPRIVIIDESWDLLGMGDAATFMEHGYRRFRKYGGAAVTITQSVNDLYRSPTGRAIVENSANMYLLGQKAEAIEALKAERRLPLGIWILRRPSFPHRFRKKFSRIFSSWVISLAFAAIAFATINRSKGSRVQVRDCACPIPNTRLIQIFTGAIQRLRVWPECLQTAS